MKAMLFGALVLAIAMAPVASAKVAVRDDVPPTKPVTATYDVSVTYGSLESSHSGTVIVNGTDVDCGGGGTFTGKDQYHYICR